MSYLYGAACDSCGKRIASVTQKTFDFNSLIGLLENTGWIRREDITYCPTCAAEKTEIVGVHQNRIKSGVDTTSNNVVAYNIRMYLRAHGMRQKEFAAKIGISPQAMNGYLHGKSRPSEKVLEKMADFLGISKADIDTSYIDMNNVDWR